MRLTPESLQQLRGAGRRFLECKILSTSFNLSSKVVVMPRRYSVRFSEREQGRDVEHTVKTRMNGSKKLARIMSLLWFELYTRCSDALDPLAVDEMMTSRFSHGSRLSSKRRRHNRILIRYLGCPCPTPVSKPLSPCLQSRKSHRY